MRILTRLAVFSALQVLLLAGCGSGHNAAPTAASAAAMKKAATEFESFFLYYMLKTMRQAVPKGGLLDSKVGETYMGMLDQEVANQAAKQGGFGLAKSIERQFYPPLPGGSSFPPAPPIKSTEEEGP